MDFTRPYVYVFMYVHNYVCTCVYVCICLCIYVCAHNRMGVFAHMYSTNV